MSIVMTMRPHDLHSVVSSAQQAVRAGLHVQLRHNQSAQKVILRSHAAGGRGGDKNSTRRKERVSAFALPACMTSMLDWTQFSAAGRCRSLCAKLRHMPATMQDDERNDQGFDSAQSPRAQRPYGCSISMHAGRMPQAASRKQGCMLLQGQRVHARCTRCSQKLPTWRISCSESL